VIVRPWDVGMLVLYRMPDASCVPELVNRRAPGLAPSGLGLHSGTVVGPGLATDAVRQGKPADPGVAPVNGITGAEVVGDVKGSERRTCPAAAAGATVRAIIPPMTVINAVPAMAVRRRTARTPLVNPMVLPLAPAWPWRAHAIGRHRRADSAGDEI
jgi:hypothetical protein